MRQVNCLLLIGWLVFSPDAMAKKRCKPFLEKLHNIQAMQRNGYSSKRGVSLRDREDKARDVWWQCETGRSKKSNKKTNDKKKNKTNKTTNLQGSRFSKNKTIKAGTPFKTNNAVVIKSHYQGAKKQAWLKFYQQPKGCMHPKSLSEFAFCSENKRTQRSSFDNQYTQ